MDQFKNDPDVYETIKKCIRLDEMPLPKEALDDALNQYQESIAVLLKSAQSNLKSNFE